MKILTARINGFRNLQEAELTFSPQVNLFLGDNGQGKTNLLEALNFLALGRSHRGSQNEELIGFDTDGLYVSLEVDDPQREATVFEFGIERGGRRRFKIDGQTVRKRVDLVGRLATVFFDPDGISLVRGSPQKRRNFLDRGVSMLDPAYFEHLQAYRKALRQKARLLREARNGQYNFQGFEAELQAWNRKLAKHAAPVYMGRHSYTHEISPLASDKYHSLVENSGRLDFIFQPQLSAANNSLESAQFEAEILRDLDYIMRDEIRRARPLAGPQFDDCEVRLSETDLRTFGSQGETRSAAISLILAQSDLLFRKVNVRPVLFLDDVFSELDRNRARRLQELTAGKHQVFVATARQDDIAQWRPEGMKVWQVINGTIESQA